MRQTGGGTDDQQLPRVQPHMPIPLLPPGGHVYRAPIDRRGDLMPPLSGRTVLEGSKRPSRYRRSNCECLVALIDDEQRPRLSACSREHK